MLITNARVVSCGPCGSFHGWIRVLQGKIDQVGSAGLPELEPGEEIIDVRSKWVLPGLIDAATTLGLSSLESAPDWDADEHTNPVTPKLRAYDTINPLDPGFDEALSGGVTTVYTGPGDGNVIAGQGAVLKTAGEPFSSRLVSPTHDLKIALGGKPKA